MGRRICIVGTGYVGLMAAAGLADFGNQVTGVDRDTNRIARLAAGEVPIYEPGLEPYLEANTRANRLHFTGDIGSALSEAEAVFITVGTPPLASGDTDLRSFDAAVADVSRHAAHETVVVIKSTVPIGTGDQVWQRLHGSASTVEVVSNPEFLREGHAIHDFFHPDKVVIGATSDRAREVMVDIYRPLYRIETPFVFCSRSTAEIIKYANNAFLATKVTFINQLAVLCEAADGDVHTVAKAMGMDGRVSGKFLHPGPGFGGSCFPKDLESLVYCASQFGINLSLPAEVLRANEAHKEWVAEKIDRVVGGVAGRRLSILGLSYKADTDDVRESPAIAIANRLADDGAELVAFDPRACANASTLLHPDVALVDSPFDAAAGADALIVFTEWNEFRNMDMARLATLMRGRQVIDFRNVVDPGQAAAAGLACHSVGRPTGAP